MTLSKGATKRSILLVDDEAAIVRFIKDALEDKGFHVFTAFDGKQALQIASQERLDLVILDIMLPHLDGFRVCRALREELTIPIVLLSAKQSDVDKVQGFGVGADDYVVKPFSIKELIARVEAHLRRESRGLQQRVSHVLSDGRLVVDLVSYEARYEDQVLPLTRKEFEMLQLFLLHPHQVFSQEVIYNRIWGLDALGNTKTVAEHVKRLRQKLAAVDAATEYISTIWGVGYKWKPITL